MGGTSAPCNGRDPDQGPPAWLSYITVTDVDAVIERAREAHATVDGPIDVLDAGRMAMIQDPTGAHVAAWQPLANIGAELVNVPGALCLNQLNTADPDRATRFYTDVFGWRFEEVATGEQAYWGIFNGTDLNGGLMPLPPGAGAPSHWLVYFATADLAATVARVSDLGGRVVLPPTGIPSGRISVAVDPQGAIFALFEGELDP